MPPESGANDSTGEASAASYQPSTAVTERGAGGRPTKLTAHTVDRIVTAIASGQSRNTAATMGGISTTSLYAWLAEGRTNPESAGADLLRRIEEAEAAFLAKQIARIDQAAQDGTWQAAAWLSERKDPANWGRKSQVQVEHGIAPAPADPAIGGHSMLMQQVVFNLNANPDKSTWPEPMRRAFDAMTGATSDSEAVTIDGQADKAEAPPSEAER